MSTEKEFNVANHLAQKLIWALYIHSCCVGKGRIIRERSIQKHNRNPTMQDVWGEVTVDMDQSGSLVFHAAQILGKPVWFRFAVDKNGNVENRIHEDERMESAEFIPWAWRFQSLEEAVNYCTYLPVDVDHFYLLNQEIQALVHYWEANKMATPLEDIGVLALGFTADEGINPATSESLVYYLTKYHMEKHGNREALLHIAEAGLN